MPSQLSFVTTIFCAEDGVMGVVGLPGSTACGSIGVVSTVRFDMVDGWVGYSCEQQQQRTRRRKMNVGPSNVSERAKGDAEMLAASCLRSFMRVVFLLAAMFAAKPTGLSVGSRLTIDPR